VTDIFAIEAINGDSLRQAGDVFERVTRSIFSWEAMVALVVAIVVAIIAGRVIAAILRRVVVIIGRQADRTPNLQTVNRLRRYETIIVLSIAIIRTFLFIFALYLWWIYIHPTQQPTAIIGASALAAIILGSTLSPVLRDIASGGVMMAEQWYAVGDHVKLEPFGEMQGVVERVTLRSTRLRGLNGEVIWVNNQSIQGVRITPRGIVTMAIEIFVTDLKAGRELVESTNRRLPSGKLLVVNPLHMMTSDKVGDKLWHITAIAETAPGREWLLDKYALEVMKEIDSSRKTHILSTDPVARFADSVAEQKFARSITNARKDPSDRSALKAAKREAAIHPSEKDELAKDDF
jgi:moderate conductance mechanosensitive channel